MSYIKYKELAYCNFSKKIDIKDLPVSTRLSKGTKLVPVKRGDAIFKIKKNIQEEINMKNIKNIKKEILFPKKKKYATIQLEKKPAKIIKKQVLFISIVTDK